MADGSPLRQYQAPHDIRHVRSGGFDPDQDDVTCVQIGRDPNSPKRAGRSSRASALQGATGLSSVMPLIIGTVPEWLNLKRLA